MGHGIQKRVRALLEVLLSFDDFQTFKDMMYEHNVRMQLGQSGAVGAPAPAANVAPHVPCVSGVWRRLRLARFLLRCAACLT